jgi:hypothetical protein
MPQYLIFGCEDVAEGDEPVLNDNLEAKII